MGETEEKDEAEEVEEGVVAATVNRHPTFWMRHPSHHWVKKLMWLKNEEQLFETELQNSITSHQIPYFLYYYWQKNHSVIPSGFRHCKGEETYFSFIKTDASNYIYTQISSVVVVVFRLPSSAVSNFLKCLQFFFVEIPSR